MDRRRFLKLALAAAPLALGLSAAREAYSFELPRERRVIRGLREPLRLAFLTDLHLGPYLGRRQLEEWVAATVELEPDLVVFGGDIVDQEYDGDLSEVVELLPRLRPPLGVVAVLGNHDRTRYRDLSPFRRALREAGVTLLVNEGVQLRDDLYLAGLDDWRTGHPDIERTLAGGGEGARVLLSHNPDVIPRLPDHVDLLLAGHTHGGQVRLPLLGPLVTSSEYGRRYAEGWVEAPMPAFVSRGLGVTVLPFRLFCPPELVLLDLQPA
ncbi:MAG: metallophosphoesterase [Deinococcales bacterium]|nr:metallophosphoesterase [Deinococcales bacterium]